ncbi:MAG: Type 1 phosphatases regulator ypi1 [Ramalina farinacea]|uniref:Type 1 phosphatases regulator n=1 Tax=Ramalina farinacea TaxID=258253 RepID=A0AA43QKF9_9LECA|nr:Type 1 phosphatases regulator ypi1 [Ramalina farinacea]
MSVHTHASSATRTLRPTRAPNSTTPTATQTITSTPVLRLRATAPPEQARRPRIQWAEDVVDNEGLGRKRSKVCCIYHAPHPVGESSSESDSSESDLDGSDESSGNDDGAARMAGRNRKGSSQKRKANRDSNQHGHDECNGHEHVDATKDDTAPKKPSRNAYEKLPKRRGGSKTMVEVKN